MSIAQPDAPDIAPTALAPDPREAFLHWEASTRDSIDVKRTYIKIAGDHIAGVLLSQIAYWNLPSNRGEIDRLRVRKEGKFWLAKKRTDWVDECVIKPKQFGVPGVISGKFSVRETATKSLLSARHDYI